MKIALYWEALEITTHKKNFKEIHWQYKIAKLIPHVV